MSTAERLLYVSLQLKESKRAVNSLRDFVDDDDDDDLERVSWTGEPVGSKLKRPCEGFLSGMKAVPSARKSAAGRATWRSTTVMPV